MTELEAIRRDRRAVQQCRQELEHKIAHRQAELAEMRTALAALDRLNGQTPQGYRPASRDTVGKRIVAYLHEHGRCTSYEIADGLAAKWRSDLRFHTVSTTLSRLRRRDAVSRTPDGKWRVE